MLDTKKVITGTSWNNTEFYWNWFDGKFIQFDQADIWASDHFDSDEDGLKDVIEFNNSELAPLTNIRLREVEM